MENTDKNKSDDKKLQIGRKIGIIGIIGIIISLIMSTFINDLPFWPFMISMIFVIIGILSIPITYEKTENKTKNIEINSEKFIFSGKYISGHPKIDESKENIYLHVKNEVLKIYEFNERTNKKYFLANIDTSKIKDISLEDKSSIKRRVGLKRMLVLGLFAFAIKKKVKYELAYVVISWTDDRFTNETVFEFQEEGSISKANKLRNYLINNI